LNYRWRDTDATLTALAAERREPAVTLRYVNPLTGESALPTLGCAMTRLQPGARTSAMRRAGSAVYVVFRGRGTQSIDGVRFDGCPGDSFAVPSWAVVDHQADELADLFSIDDRPLLEKLGLFREARLEEPQPIHERFQPR